MADINQIVELLRNFPFLKVQPEQVLDHLATHSQLLRYKFGQPLASRHQSPSQVYFLLQGTVRSVVLSDRFRRGVSTLQRIQPGNVLCWSALSAGKNYETLIASSDVVVLAIPNDIMRQAMQMHAPLMQLVVGSVNPSELFAVIDTYLKEFPRVLSSELIETSVVLAESSRGAIVAASELSQLSQDGILWIVSSGPVPVGTRLDPFALPSADPDSLWRLVGLNKALLQDLLDQTSIPEPSSSDDEEIPTDPEKAQPNSVLQFEAWQKHEVNLSPEEIVDAPPLEIDNDIDVPDELDRSPESYPFTRGDGPLDSGLAAFQMLCSHLNLPFRRELFRRVLVDHVKSHQSVSLALAGAISESIGLQSQLLEVQTVAFPRLETPLLIRWGTGLAVVYRVARNEVLLGVPAGGTGNSLLTIDEFTDLWGEEGEVLALQKTQATPQRKFGYRWFLPALRKHRAVLIEVLLASFFAQLFALVNPLLIQQVIDKAIINSSPDALTLLGVMLIVFALFEGLLITLRTLLFVDTTNRIDLSLGTRIIDHLLRLPISYFDRRPVGEVSSRVAELENVRSFLTGTALTTILDAVFAMLYVVVMIIYSWKLTLLTLAVIPFLIALVLGVSPIVRQQLQDRAVANAKTQSHLVEVLSSMMTVKAQNIELRSRWKWQELYTDFVAEGFDNTLVSTIASNLAGFLNKLSSLLVIWGGAYLVLGNEMTLGELIAFRIISSNVTGPLLRMTSIWQSIQEVSLSLERLSDVIDTPQEASDGNYQKMSMPKITGNIQFNDVFFRYKQSSPLLLQNINLEIPAGSFVALVGTSGSGKSTLTKLVSRLYTPEKGTVVIDGIDVSKVELYSLRRQLGVVPQDTVLFDGSIEENIALTNPDATSDEIVQAAKIAAAHDFIMELPAGYSTQVGERGSGLSGGQRQRIAIARTILQQPSLLIMDEATSALDYYTEKVVSENLMNKLKGSTVLFITHRLSSITNADLIVFMSQGAVLETGRHDELMKLNGSYAALFRQQGRYSSSSSSSSSSSRSRSSPVFQVGSSRTGTGG